MIIVSTIQGFVVIASGNRVSLWNVENKKCIKEFLGHEDR
jgi:WD40 repeat protein